MEVFRSPSRTCDQVYLSAISRGGDLWVFFVAMLPFLNRGVQFFIDVLVLSTSLWLAYLFRYEFDIPPQVVKRTFFAWPYVVLLQYGLMTFAGVPRFSWRHVTLRDIKWIFASLCASTLVLVGLRLLFSGGLGASQFVRLPIGVLCIDLLIASAGIVGVRILRRLMAERDTRRRHQGTSGVKVASLLIGAGDAGSWVAREAKSRSDLNIHPVGFVDDDVFKVGTLVQGLRVLGTTEGLAAIANKHGVTQAIITVANAPRARMRAIVEQCKEAGLATKIIPSLGEIVEQGTSALGRIRDVAIDDLLGRAPVELDNRRVAAVTESRVVLVSGAGGSIGSELCRQICRFNPSALVLLELSENALFHSHRNLLAAFPDVPIIPCVGDVRDKNRMHALFEEHRPKVVFHAAAHKHVPMMEWNPGEAIKNNVLGTQVLADMANEFEASHFVMISTDKAVNPTSVMGATKRVAELYIQALSQRSKTVFVAVRFGNVLGSAGSVVPLFKEQIAAGGPVTVTDPEMRRYFMTISEACQLVLQAASMGAGGEIFILDMGDPVRITDLAHDLIKLSGLEPNVDIDVVFTGVRPGEKLFEELSVDEEKAEKTRHPKIFIGRLPPRGLSDVQFALRRLEETAHKGDPLSMRSVLGTVVPEYSQGSGDSRQASLRAV